MLLLAGVVALAGHADDFLARAVPELEEASFERARYAQPFQGEDTAFLDQVLDEIFPGALPENSEARALAVMSYVAQKYPSGPPSQYNRTGAAALQTSPNLCGDKALAMVALCRRMDIPARVVPMNNFTALNAHIAAEVWYDDDWHYMDPTFGAFYYTAPSYDGSGSIPSMRTLATQPALRRHPLFIGPERLWAGEYDPGAAFVPLPRDFQNEPWQPFSVAETLDKALALSFPIERAPDRPRSFPVSFNLQANASEWRGEVNGDPHDLSSPAAAGEVAPRHYGTHFIGAGDNEHVFHTVVVHQPAGARVRVSYHFLHDAPHAQLDIIELKDAVIARIETGPKAWHIEFTAQSELSMLLVANRGPALLLDALHATLAGASNGHDE